MTTSAGDTDGVADIAANIAGNIDAVRATITAAARRCSRDPSDVRLIGVSKGFDAATAAAALDAGLTDLGENRAQELLTKHPEVEALATGQDTPAAVWHFVGRLQRNKVRTLAPVVSWWHSVDRDVLADEIARRAPKARVLIQVDLGGEESKGGCAPAETEALAAHCSAADLDVRGLMTVPPHADPARPYFAALRTMADDLGLPDCSMGMSEDVGEAVEEGATLVRVGRAIFGRRPGPVGVE